MAMLRSGSLFRLPSLGALKFFVVTIVAFSQGSSAEVEYYCPNQHCIKQTDTTAFSCEQYIDEGYQCAFEDDARQCKCDGNVKYGNYVVWGQDVQITGTSPCTNAVFTDVVPGFKACWCTPNTLTSTIRRTSAAVFGEAASVTIPAGYSKASCMAGEVTHAVPDVAMALLPGDVVKAAYYIAAPGTLDRIFNEGNEGTKLVLVNVPTQTSTFTTPGVHFVKMQSLREDASQLKTEMMKYSELLATDPNAAEIAMMGGLVTWSVPVFPSTPGTTTLPDQTSTVGIASSTSCSFVCSFVVGAGILASAAAMRL